MAENPIAWNDTTPAAPAGKVNVKFQADAPDANPSVARNATAYMPVMTNSVGGAVPTPPNDATRYLDGTGAFSVPAGGGGGGGGETVLATYDGSSLTGWTNSGCSIDSFTQAFSIPVGGSNGMHRDVAVTAPSLTTFKGASIEFDLLLSHSNTGSPNVPDSGELSFFFGCNSSGSGLMIQIAGRAFNASTPMEIYSTTSFTAWNWVSTERQPALFLTDVRWYHIKISISSDGTTVKLYVDNVLQHTWTTCKNGDSVSTFSNNGTYIGFNGDTNNDGCFVRNLIVEQP